MRRGVLGGMDSSHFSLCVTQSSGRKPNYRDERERNQCKCQGQQIEFDDRYNQSAQTNNAEDGAADRLPLIVGLNEEAT